MCTILVDEARDFVNREKLVLALSGLNASTTKSKSLQAN